MLEWLYETADIRLSCGLKYNGTELKELPPGAKGFVLLILYLGMDTADTGPLIVEQPGETWTTSPSLSCSRSTCSVVVGASTETFTSGTNCTGTFTSLQQMGSTLVYTSGTQTYTYTMRDGTVITFYKAGANQSVQIPVGIVIGDGIGGFVKSVTTPTGDVTTYSYETELVCYPDPFDCVIQWDFWRLLTISTNAGYRLWFTYPGAPSSQVQPTRVSGVNNSVEYCVPPSCANVWPSATYTYMTPSYPFPTSMTNALGAATTYTHTSIGGQTALTEVQYPDHANHDINIGYNTSRQVSSVDLGFGTWTYAYTDASGSRTTVVTNPDTPSTTRRFNSTIANGRINWVMNELNQNVFVYQYDGAARQTRVTLSEGNYTQYTYDSRGNITQVSQVAKPGSGLANIVTSASFPASCTNPRTCNQPTSTTDARGFRTDYAYDTTHGGVLTVTAPAPTGPVPVGSGDRPQTRFTYAQFQARYLTTPTIWANGAAVWRPTVQSTCASGVSPGCLNTANETRVTAGYLGSATANNALPVSVTSASGSGSISSVSAFTYTNWSDVKTIDGPLPGTADTTWLYYDNLRRVIGVVGPDPDGGGALNYRATRTTYNTVGQPTVVERGTVTSQSDTAMSSFVTLEKQETEYDQFARPVTSRAWAGVSILALVQMNYDSRGRPLCTATRMNSALFGSPPADACTQGTAGSFGPDRIARSLYDVAGRLSEQQSAYGTSLAQTTATYTYTGNGQVATLKNARNYLTTYEYDGFDRLSKLRYPLASTPNSSSTTDFDQTIYDSFGQIYQERRRGGDLFTYTWDNLRRVTLRDAPGTQPDVSFGYDLLSRETSRSQSGNSLTTVYDALSRTTSVTSTVPSGTVSYQYDAANRRTRMDYPGGFYVTYAYNTAGDLTGILENGATNIATYAYDDLARRTSLNRGGVVSTFTYDGVSRLSTLGIDPASTSHDTTFTFGYTPSSQIASRTRTNSVYDWTLAASFSDVYTTNGLNQYTNVDAMVPTHDSRGNMQFDGADTHGYDYDNRLISKSGGVTLNYDPAGRLQELTGAATTRFLYDGTDMIAEYNTSGTVLRRFVHGPGADEPLVWYEGSGTGDKRYLIADERGSVIGVTNSSGTVTTVNKYDAYGMGAAGNDGRFRYTGQMWLPEANIYHYKGRAYKPVYGRFYQTDPIGYGDGMNLYAYVGNDPVNFRDPTGRTKEATEDWLDEIVDSLRDEAMRLMGGLPSADASQLPSNVPSEDHPPGPQQDVPGVGCTAVPAFMSDPGVGKELDRAWADSNPYAPSVPRGAPGSLKSEQGGWIVKWWLFGGYDVVRVAPGTRDSLPTIVGTRPWPVLRSVEGWFHTHPNTSAENYADGPSPGDINFTRNYARVPGVIKTHSGDQFVCP